MKVFFTCPTSNLVKWHKKYRNWLDYIIKNGHSIENDWIDSAKNFLKSKIKGDTKEFYEAKIDAINSADVIIAESSVKSYGVAHQISVAISKSKPVLVLMDKKYPVSSIEAIKSEWLTQEFYKNDQQAIKHIDNFLNTYKNSKKVRFHLVMSHKENEHLEKLMEKTNKSKTEIIRGLIRNAS
jgi:nucleoside 2-deoxyribosyltransferase